jgi:hypothetical protein
MALALTRLNHETIYPKCLFFFTPKAFDCCLNLMIHLFCPGVQKLNTGVTEKALFFQEEEGLKKLNTLFEQNHFPHRSEVRGL